MKKILSALFISLVFASPIHAEDPLVADPILKHLELAMEDDKHLEYSLKRCSGLFLATGTTLHKIVEENHPDTQAFVDFGENLMKFLAKYQITVINESELTQVEFDKTYRGNIEEVQRMNKRYQSRMRKNFSTFGTLTEDDEPLSNDVWHCLGFHEQLFPSN